MLKDSPSAPPVESASERSALLPKLNIFMRPIPLCPPPPGAPPIPPPAPPPEPLLSPPAPAPPENPPLCIPPMPELPMVSASMPLPVSCARPGAVPKLPPAPARGRAERTVLCIMLEKKRDQSTVLEVLRELPGGCGPPPPGPSAWAFPASEGRGPEEASPC
ncbi:hypothetical protein ESZ00_14810 [Silvibacterium dinghuense]|uniref:Uncharacterized protein n=1 Tax=Silvibacterium dinghuense TaxID=1560006 RepID=A0A4Q1SBB9_9BACT|nr:hypothetical protein ESZ00_14810 [Silvibacterium dinghuense]